MSLGDRAGEGCTRWGSAPYSPALSSSTVMEVAYGVGEPPCLEGAGEGRRGTALGW